MHDAITIARHGHEFGVGPIERRVEHRIQKAPGAGKRVEASRRRDPLGVLYRHPNIVPAWIRLVCVFACVETRYAPKCTANLVDLCGIDGTRHEIDGKGRPSGYWGVEEMDGKIAGDAAIGEPTAFQRDLASLRHSPCIEGNGAK